MRHRSVFSLVFFTVVALAVLACQSPPASPPLQAPINSNTCLQPTCEEIQVQRGEVTIGVTAFGTLRYSGQASLTAPGDTLVTDVSVGLGEQVQAGQVLATLDPSALELEVVEARIALKEAQKALEDGAATPAPEDVERAEIMVSSAQRRAARLEAELVSLMEGPARQSSVASAQADVAAAEMAVRDAQEALDLAMSRPTAQELAEAELAAVNTRTTLATAQARLEQLQSKSGVLSIKQAEAQLGIANAQLAEARQVLAQVEQGPDPELIQALKIDVERARAALEIAQLRETMLTSEPPVGLSDAELNMEQREARVEVLEASLELRRAEDALEEAEAGPTLADIAGAEQAVIQAEIAVAEADANLSQAQKGLGSAALISEAEAAVASASTAHQEAIEHLEQIQAGPDPQEVALRESELAAARSQLEDAQQRLSLVQQGPDPVLVQEKQAELEEARAALQAAKTELAEVEQGDRAERLRLQLEVAQDNLARAEENLSRATVVAPFNGRISAINVTPGQRVVQGDLVVQVMGSNPLEMTALVSEADVSRVKVGQPANVTVSALPGAVFSGQVMSVAASGQGESGQVMYEVVITGRGLSSPDLQQGMTAVADIVSEQRSDVLVVPADAIERNGQQSQVEVINGETPTTVPVKTGLSNGRVVEVVEGLQEGQLIRVRWDSIDFLGR